MLHHADMHNISPSRICSFIRAETGSQSHASWSRHPSPMQPPPHATATLVPHATNEPRSLRRRKLQPRSPSPARRTRPHALSTAPVDGVRVTERTPRPPHPSDSPDELTESVSPSAVRSPSPAPLRPAARCAKPRARSRPKSAMARRCAAGATHSHPCTVNMPRLSSTSSGESSPACAPPCRSRCSCTRRGLQTVSAAERCTAVGEGSDAGWSQCCDHQNSRRKQFCTVGSEATATRCSQWNQVAGRRGATSYKKLCSTSLSCSRKQIGSAKSDAATKPGARVATAA
mmetsp:Transcript_4235/g.12378  ORF Transcript_4235/g.12378 Transcript_4235/m.12378 type:complete len:287 (-) Transcript_4235:799-1659(-)